MKSFRRSCVLPANGDLHLERRELFVIFDNLILRASCIGRDFECAQHGLPRSTEVLLKDGKQIRSEEHTSELQSLMRISYAVFCLTKNNRTIKNHRTYTDHTH